MKCVGGIAAAVAVALLAGCGGDPSDRGDEVVDPAPPESTETFAAPGSCEALVLEAGAVIAGKVLGQCVTDALSAYGTGREKMTGENLEGTFDFHYGDRPALAGRGQTPSGSFEVVLIADEAWIKMDGRWIEGQPDSGDPQQAFVGSIGQIYRAYAMPHVAVDLISSATTWRVAEETEPLELPGDDTVEVWSLSATGSFTWNGITAEEATVWIGTDMTPYGNTFRSSIGGISSTASQIFYDHGAQIDIEPPL